MATIKTSLMLVDKMSAPLKSINKAMNIVLSSMESVARASGTMIDNRAIQQARIELEQTERALNGLSDTANETYTSFSQLAKGIGLVVVARKAFDVVKSGIDYASDLAEVQNVVDVSFGNSADSINSWAKEALNAYGMNEVTAKRYAGTIGAMLKSSGLAGDSIVDMSKDLSGLAGDVASFYNLDLDEAFTKIRSGISGETEPLKTLGITMTVANLEAYALSQGITKSYTSMTQAEQVMLRYNYLMSASADAQGDFARTQNSWANQTRLLTENWRQFTGVMASSVLPVLTQIVKVLNQGVTFLTEAWPIISPIIYGAAIAVGVLALSMINWAGVIGACTTAFKYLGAVMAMNPFMIVIMALAGIVALFNGVIRGINKFEDKSLSAAGVAAGAISWVGALFKNVGMLIANIFFAIIALVAAITGNISTLFGNSIAQVIANFWDLASCAAMVISQIAESLNKLPFVNIDVEGLTTAATGFRDKAQSWLDKKQDYVDVEAAMKNGFNTFDAFGEGWSSSAYDAGYDWGSNLFGGGTGTNYGEETSENTASIAESAGSAAASLDKSSEDLKYLRDIAEQEAINRFTTAEVKIDMTGMTNRIDSSMDIDGIIRTLADGFAEAVSVAAEGVH